VADPLVRTALSDLKILLTDGIGDDNISTGGIGAGSLASDSVTTAKILNGNVTAAKLEDTPYQDAGLNSAGVVRRGVTSIATEETTTSTSYTLLTTEDQVENVVLPTDGILWVKYRALWKLTGASNAGAAAIFIGSNQLKAFVVNTVPAVAEASLAASGDNYGLVYSEPINAAVGTTGLDSLSSGTSDASFVTTGMADSHFLAIEAAAGTYTVSIQFHVNATNGGTLSVKERKLWVKAEGF